MELSLFFSPGGIFYSYLFLEEKNPSHPFIKKPEFAFLIFLSVSFVDWTVKLISIFLMA